MGYKTELTLGATYRDTVSGWEGTCTAVHFYMNGCVRASVDATDKDGQPKGYVFDEEQLELVQENTPQVKKAQERKPSGGPRDNTPISRP